MCGGTVRCPRPTHCVGGLSPRVRGNPEGLTYGNAWYGSIPACAGEPVNVVCRQAIGGVYPRVCGGTLTREAERLWTKGLSPRVRGNRERKLAHSPRAGSIPACAGNRGTTEHRRAGQRSIPACAGEPGPGSRKTRWRKVYPRVCGGTSNGDPALGARAGLSPRVRGNRPDSTPPARRTGSIPACAGEPSR